MKKQIGIAAAALVLCAGIALAQNGTPRATSPKSAPTPSASAGSNGSMMGSGMGMQGSGMSMHGSGMMGMQGSGTTGGMMGMGAGMMGSGMMGDGMMESCSCSADAKGVHVDVKKVPKGVSITYTSEDASAVARIQKRAEAVRLMHESCSQ